MLSHETIERCTSKFLEWDSWHKWCKRLQRHEMLKSILAVETNGVPEYEIKLGERKGRVDIVADKTAIEIDDGPNLKAMHKLVTMRSRGFEPLWILILGKGRGGKSYAEAKKLDIPTLRIFVGPNRSEFEWI